MARRPTFAKLSADMVKRTVATPTTIWTVDDKGKPVRATVWHIHDRRAA
jgi:hypothetical protein